MKSHRAIKYIPNIFTLTNISLGLASVLFLIQSEHQNKALVVPVLIFLGGVADFFDGYFARKLGASTNLGKNLDSFADIITFGVAPIALINYLSISEHSVFMMVASLIFIMAGAYRLARYNLKDFSSHFMGLPITAAGIMLALYSVTYPHWATDISPIGCEIITTIIILLLSALMISKRSFKRPLILNKKAG